MSTTAAEISYSPVEKGGKIEPRVSNLEMWRAVKTRDYHHDGIFVFAVSSTGVYCRPSCPARRPRRTYVAHFSSPEGAEKAGFRPCRRCRPNDGAFVSLQRRRIRQVCNYIDGNLDGKIDLTELARQVNLSPFHLQRLFRKILGVSPREYAEATRMSKVKLSLKNGELSETQSTSRDAAPPVGSTLTRWASWG